MDNHPNSAECFRADDAKKSNLIGQRLLSTRKKLGLKQSDISTLLQKYGVNISAKQVSKWENGESIPNVYQFLALCYALKLDPAAFTGKVPSIYDVDDDSLNKTGDKFVSEFRNFLVSSGHYAPKRSIRWIKMPVLKNNNLPTPDESK